MKLNQVPAVAVMLATCVTPSAAVLSDEADIRLRRAKSLREETSLFIKQHCLECHSADERGGDFDLTQLDYDVASSRETADAWRKAAEKLTLGEMPPEEQARPRQKELDAVIERINDELQFAAKVLRKKGGGEVLFRRLNKRQFSYTIQDLFGLEGDFAASFPDDAVEHGFDNIGSGLVLSASQMQSYLAIADTILDKAVVLGERPKGVDFAFKLTDSSLKRGQPDPKTGRVRPYLAEYQGDDVIISRSGIPEIWRRFRAPAEGRYRIRITAYAIRNDGKRLRLEVHHGNTWTRSLVPTLDGQVEVVDDKPKTFEFTAHMKRSQSFSVTPPDLLNWLKPDLIGDYDGPGIVIRKVEIDGPLIDRWPPKSHQVIFGERQSESFSDEEVRDMLRRFASRAFRRRAPDDEVKAYFQLYEQAKSEGDNDLTALRHGLKAILCSPLFLYLYEEPGKLDDFALASRLSYFLWCSTPDDELFRLAARKQFSKPEVLKQQIARMIKDPKINRFVNDFAGQWLDVDRVGEMKPDARLYPEYDAFLERSMIQETQRFFREVLVENLSIENFIDSDFAMLNDRLAEHYGIPDVAGGEVRRVELPRDSHRGGLLTQGSILMVTSNGTTTSPVVRGAWVLENFVGQPSPPPPPVGTDIEPDIRGATTIKEQLAKHRTIPQCNVCHRKIDPFGLALENFDVAGGWRDRYRKVKPGSRPSARRRFGQYVLGPSVESFGDSPQLGKFDGFESFRKLLLANKQLVVRCVTEKMMTYALGRGLDFADEPTIDRITKQLDVDGNRLQSLVEQIVLSKAFQTN